MNELLKMMTTDHDGIDRIIEGLNGKSDVSEAVLYELKKRFIRHFTWEEQVLFPEFEKKAGVYGKDIVFVLKSEHKQILSVLKGNINKHATSEAVDQSMLMTLLEILNIHREMEQDIFYPWFEENLDEEELNSLIKSLKSKYSFEVENE